MTIRNGATEPCPHCGVVVRFESAEVLVSGASLSAELDILTRSGNRLSVVAAACPNCGLPVVTAVELDSFEGAEDLDLLLWPDATFRPVAAEVREQAPAVAADFEEAAQVLSKSKKASAAISRRCLQHVLREMGGAKSHHLSAQIDEVLANLPSHLASNVDAIRQVGNFAAHPLKDTNTGEVAQVEQGEAEWLLEVLEDLFDHYYVIPARAEARRDQLNKKLAALGKPPLKGPSAG